MTEKSRIAIPDKASMKIMDLVRQREIAEQKLRTAIEMLRATLEVPESWELRQNGDGLEFVNREASVDGES